jgi:CHAD domain-containing protein
MSYRLNEREPLDEGVRRVIREQVDKALERIDAKPNDRDDAIHDARVCFKKIRAVLRLVRAELNGTYNQENKLYRDLGRRLSSVRNDTAMIESFKKLRERFSDQLSNGAFSQQRRQLVQSNTQRQTEKAKVLAEVRKTLIPARRRIEKWSMRTDDFSVLTVGLRSIYKRGRSDLVTASDDPTVENLHSFRKGVKYLWYNVRLLRPLWPKPLSKLADELEQLGDYLSDDHDLALLRQRIAEHPSNGNRGRELEAFIALIDQRRAELELEAKLLGQRVYAEKPRAFSRRFETYWSVWQSEIKAEPIAATAAKRA